MIKAYISLIKIIMIVNVDFHCLVLCYGLLNLLNSCGDCIAFVPI